MQHKIITEHSNQLHQLLVSVSRRDWTGKPDNYWLKTLMIEPVLWLTAGRSGFSGYGGAGSEANQYLKVALHSNCHVPEYLLKKKFLPFGEPESYSWGSPEEAVIYVNDARESWKKTPGALEWLNGAGC